MQYPSPAEPMNEFQRAVLGKAAAEIRDTAEGPADLLKRAFALATRDAEIAGLSPARVHFILSAALAA